MKLAAAKKHDTDTAIGIDKKTRAKIAGELGRLLADVYGLQLKTQFYHWNVVGPYFQQLHDMFGAQYTTLNGFVDALAERIRALGFPAPGTFHEFIKLGRIAEDKSVPASWQTMVANLLAGHEAVIRAERDAIHDAADAGDEGTADLLTGQMEEHEKIAWMLRSVLG